MMNNQEAIKILSELHDQCCQADSIFCTDTTGARCEAVDMAISALEKQDATDTNDGDMISRQASCVYCNEDVDGYVKPIEKNSHAFIRFGMFGWELDLSAKGWHGSAKIKYCPMCGRRLKDG